MSVYIFVGPTLPVAEITALLDAVCLPPVAQGDVYRAAVSRARAIGIVDGYFDGMPAVWHKEILWAMSQGIHVFGSASMGALRAAELHTFGMRGVGDIFAAYKAGDFEDDDEVAVVHGPAAIGYPSLSEPMVNMRATLAEAERRGIISGATQERLVESAKAMFYQDRSWERLLSEAVVARAGEDELQRLRDWLPTGRIDQKRRDAHAMIVAMRDFLAPDPPPMQAPFRFEWTDMWEISTQSAPARNIVDDASEEKSNDDRVLDELRLDAAAFEAVRRCALLRHAAAAKQLWPTTIDASAHRAAEQRLRMRLGLLRAAQLEQWRRDNGLTAADFARLVQEEAQLAAATTRFDETLRRDMLDQLRLDGAYARLVTRADAKRAALAARGMTTAGPADIGMTPIALVAWHFEKQRGGSVPDDLEGHVRQQGLANVADFYRVLAEEWLYFRSVGADR